MDIFDAIKKRATYRGPYKSDVIPIEDLTKIVQAAIDAPSGCNAQTTSYIIVNDESVMKKLATIMPKGGMDTAPAAIIVLADKTPAYKDITFYKEDYSAAVENIYLAATALGYATCWLDGVLRLDDINTRINTLLEIPDNLVTCVLLPIGIPAMEVSLKEKKPFNERACFNKYTIGSKN